MMKQYVYMISSYDEYGSEGVVATTNRDKLLGMLDGYYDLDPTKLSGNRLKAITLAVSEDKQTLMSLLEKSDEELARSSSGYNLGKGWGGTQLHVVELQ